jgi:hypothetical protein
MGERLAGGNVAMALLANTLATGAMLVTVLFRWLVPSLPKDAGAVVLSHPAVAIARQAQCKSSVSSLRVEPGVFDNDHKSCCNLFTLERCHWNRALPIATLTGV